MYRTGKMLSDCGLASITGLLLFVAQANALILDWDNVTWAQGSLQNSYDIDPSNPGNDITITISPSATGLFYNNTYPNINNSQSGGTSPPEKSLELWMNFQNHNQYVTVTVDFNYTAGVKDVSFSLFDIDRDGRNFVDYVSSIYAFAPDGTTKVAPTITGSPNNIVSGSGLGQTITGAGASETPGSSGLANAKIDFGNTPISSLTFKYSPGADSRRDPNAQSIAIHDISFTPVPEVQSAFLVAIFCLLFYFSRRGLKIIN